MDQLRDEVGQMFGMFSGIKCIFEDRRVTSEGDMIMIHSMRSFTANEFPMIAKCDTLMILRKPFTHRQPSNYVATDQIILKEEYLPISEQENTAENLSTSSGTDNKAKRKHRFIW